MTNVTAIERNGAGISRRAVVVHLVLIKRQGLALHIGENGLCDFAALEKKRYLEDGDASDDGPRGVRGHGSGEAAVHRRCWLGWASSVFKSRHWNRTSTVCDPFGVLAPDFVPV